MASTVDRATATNAGSGGVEPRILQRCLRAWLKHQDDILHDAVDFLLELPNSFDRVIAPSSILRNARWFVQRLCRSWLAPTFRALMGRHWFTSYRLMKRKRRRVKVWRHGAWRDGKYSAASAHRPMVKSREGKGPKCMGQKAVCSGESGLADCVVRGELAPLHVCSCVYMGWTPRWWPVTLQCDCKRGIEEATVPKSSATTTDEAHARMWVHHSGRGAGGGSRRRASDHGRCGRRGIGLLSDRGLGCQGGARACGWHVRRRTLPFVLYRRPRRR